MKERTKEERTREERQRKKETEMKSEVFVSERQAPVVQPASLTRLQDGHSLRQSDAESEGRLPSMESRLAARRTEQQRRLETR